MKAKVIIDELDGCNIFSRIDKTLRDFENCPQGSSYFEVDGEKVITDTGYAIEGMKLFVDRLKGYIRGDLMKLIIENIDMEDLEDDSD